MAGGLASSNGVQVQGAAGKNYKVPMIMMVSLFFVFGMLTVLNDILFPHFKDTFDLTYTKGMLISQAFFGAYFIMGIPSSRLIAKVGYKKAIIIGLLIIAVGCLCFFPAAKFMSYWMFLGALFIIASGITLLQVVANAYVTVLGDPEKASARISLCGGLNSTATIIGPLIGATIILNSSLFYDFEKNKQIENDLVVKTEKVLELTEGKVSGVYIDSVRTVLEEANHIRVQDVNELSAEKAQEYMQTISTLENRKRAQLALAIVDKMLDDGAKLSESVQNANLKLDVANSAIRNDTKELKANKVYVPYLFFAGFVLIMTLIFAKVKLPQILDGNETKGKSKYSALSFRHLKLGILAIFLYVGAEVAVGLLLIDFMGLDNIMQLEHDEAAFYVTLYWACAAIARFIGFAVLQKVNPKKALLAVSLVATILVSIAILSNGILALSALIGLGFCHSVMWPIIFSVALEGLGKYKTQASGYLIMGVVGGAFIPFLQGVLVDADFGLQNSFVVVLFCYIFLVYYAISGYKNVNPEISKEAGEELIVKKVTTVEQVDVAELAV